MTVAKAQQDVAAIAHFAKNYFPILFNAYSSAASKGMEMVCGSVVDILAILRYDVC